MNRIFLMVILVGLALLDARAQDRLTVFAAASSVDVMSRLSVEFQKKTNTKPVLSFAGTGQLARQIEAGAPADIIISANGEWLDWLAERQEIDPSSRINLAGNHLVVAVRTETENWVDVRGLLKTSRFAMAQPDTVPAGTYARQALKSLGLWKTVRGNAVFGENVRLALRRLELGEVEAAIVYVSDLTFAPNVREAFRIKAKSHDPIIIQAALVNRSDRSSSAQAFLDFLQSNKAGTVFREAGFSAIAR